VILGYHRLGSGFDDPFELEVTPERFTQHLDVLQRHGSILSLTDAIASLRAGRIPSRAVVLTFDDG
jgi:peptidoglycan/xylan/chitin deacetylase (PgdA/CDA1 family)